MLCNTKFGDADASNVEGAALPRGHEQQLLNMSTIPYSSNAHVWTRKESPCVLHSGLYPLHMVDFSWFGFPSSGIGNSLLGLHCWVTAM
jgi:hypothetical protein